MPLEKRPDCEPIRGYRLIEPLGSGGFGEVWKCEAPGGIFKAIKFVAGSNGNLADNNKHADEELRAVQHIKSIRHPFLLSIDRVEVVQGELLIVTELADLNLHELLEKYRQRGLAGIPRDELLTYLRETAEVLDLLNHKFDLQHLDVKPRNLFLVSNHVKVADFGLVNTLTSGGAASKLQLGAITPLYAAPELFLGKISRQSDQYSLAIVFIELLTGTMPFDGKNFRQLLIQHTQQEPNLDALPVADRSMIARALAKNPDHRFGSCMELIRGLAGEQRSVHEAAPASLPAVVSPAETVNNVQAGGDTDRPVNRSAPTVPPGVLTDLRFVECQLTSPLLEVWSAKNDEHKTRVVKFLYGFGGRDCPPLTDSVQRLKGASHPALCPNDVRLVEPGRLIVECETVKESLRDRFAQCQVRKLPGVPRGELMDYLRAAAEVLDYQYQQHAVQHLGLNPKQLVLDNGWLQIAEFGFAQILWMPAGQDIANRNARYSAPELFDKKISRHCDQFSLALVFAEMLSGVHPFRRDGNRNAGKPGVQPELDSLPPLDQEVIRRALDPDPRHRWPTCTDMMLALEGTKPEQIKELIEKDRFDGLIQASRKTPLRPPSKHRLSVKADLAGQIADIIASAGGEASQTLTTPEILPENDTVVHRFTCGQPLGAARVKLEEFQRQWNATLLAETDRSVTLSMPQTQNFWDNMFKRKPSLETTISLARINPMTATPIDVSITMRTVDLSRKRSKEVLEAEAPTIIDSLGQHLLVEAEKRTKDRLLWAQMIRVIPILPDGSEDEAIECRAKDLSPTGIGFYLPHELTTTEVIIELTNNIHPPKIVIPATLVRAKPCPDGWYEVGAMFRFNVLRKSRMEILLPPVAS